MARACEPAHREHAFCVANPGIATGGRPWRVRDVRIILSPIGVMSFAGAHVVSPATLPHARGRERPADGFRFFLHARRTIPCTASCSVVSSLTRGVLSWSAAPECVRVRVRRPHGAGSAPAAVMGARRVSEHSSREVDSMADSQQRGILGSPVSRRGVLLGGGGALAGVALGTLVHPGSAQASGGEDDDDATILKFTTMAPVTGPFVGRTNPVRGINGGGIPWKLTSAKGELQASGELEVRVRGLVLAAGPLAGTNPIANFVAIVSCLSDDGAGHVVTVNTATAPFPATTTGNSDIEAKVTLPSPCVAVSVFVGPNPNTWFAVTGM